MPRTLAHLIDGFAERGAAAALIGFGRQGKVALSYRELGQASRKLASALRASGTGAGDVVGLIGDSSPAWVIAFLGIVRAGAIAMPLSEQLPPRELARLLAHSGCRRLIANSRHARKLERSEDAPAVELLLLDEPKPAPAPTDSGETPSPAKARTLDALIAGAAEGDLPDVPPEQTAALLYTSGTTGTPKGVPLTHANLCANISALIKERLAGPGDRVLLPLPLHHVYPLTVGLLAPLTVGAAVVLPAGITGPQIMRALKEGACTIMIAVPRLYEGMLAGIQGRFRGAILGRAFQGLLALSRAALRRTGRRLGRILFYPLHRRIGPDLRLLASGGARLDPEVAWALEGLGWEVLTGYGLTETSPILTFNMPGRARLETAGRPIDGVEIRIEHAPEVEAAHGEVLARGPSVFSGYWKNPQATKESFTPEGYFRTGDLGSFDRDGYLHLVGRSKELIVLAGGKNVFPDEVEAAYGESGLVSEVAVLERQGRLVGLFVPQEAALQQQGPDQLYDELRRDVGRLSEKLPSYQRIGDFALTRRPLPRTQIGKLKRHELAAIFERAKEGARPVDERAEVSEEDRALLETPPAGEVWAFLQERFQGRRLTLDTNLQLDLGLDSFDWMSLAMELEERFAARLDDEALARVTRLRDLLEEVIDAAARGGGDFEPGELTPEQARWLQPQGRAITLLGTALFALNRALMRTVFGLRVEGLEHVPADGPLLIAPNHVSYLDPFAIAAALPRDYLQRVYWAGWTGILFTGPVTRLFSRATHVVPVDPERGLTSTLAFGRAVLGRRHALVWFPEGQRSRDGRLLRFLPGAGWLVEKTSARALPVFIDGTFAAWPPDHRLPRPHRIKIRFGAPLAPEALAQGQERAEERHAAMAERLRAAVVALGAKPAGDGR